MDKVPPISFAQERLCQLVEVQVERTPNAQAVVFAQESLTYRELNARANQLAHFLQARGVGPEVLVGVFLERSLDLVVTLLAILKAGGAYVPLDPAYPAERLAFMLTDSAVPLVLIQQDLVPHVPASALYNAQVIPLDRAWAQVRTEDIYNPATALVGDNLAYMIYTSGSTGRPKGALNTQRGICNRLLWMQENYPLDASDRVLQKTPYSFDVSVWEFFWPLIAGATLVLARPAGQRDSMYLLDVIKAERITTLHFVPSMLRIFLEAENLAQACQSLRRVFCSGESLPFEIQERFFAHCHAELHNLYGPTEASIDVTFWPCQPGEQVSLGHPIANTQIYLLDAHLHPVPIGVPGELCIGGVGLARGYYQRPELTARQFIPDPCSTEPGARIYRSGDLARYRVDGSIEYLGRLDHQIKLRGFRIELGEIEAVLQEHPGVQEAVVLLHEDGVGDAEQEAKRQLIAYLVPDRQRALPVRRLLQLEKRQQYAGLQRCELPNGMMILGQNKSEVDFLYHEIFKERSYFKHGIHLQPGDCVFDVGANIGLFSLSVAQMCPDLAIYAFEPLPALCTMLRANAELYDLPIHIFECGLSNKQETAVFTYYPHISILSGRFADGMQEREVVRSFLHNQQAFQEYSQEGERDLTEAAFDELLTERLVSEQVFCQVKTLSTVLCECGIERIDLLKVDVEKSEWNVLIGIDAEDWEKIRQIVVEVAAIGDRLRQVVEMLQQHGYAVAVEQDTSLSQSELYTVYARRPGQSPLEEHAGEHAPARLGPLVWSNPQRLIQDVRAHIKERVPDYMLPSAFILLEALPLTINGKLDQSTLHALVVKNVRAETSVIAPHTHTEHVLMEIWQEILQVKSIGSDDNFFDLGGHSLLLIRLQNRLRTVLQQKLALFDLFQYPTIRTLAHYIEQGSIEQAPFSG